MNEHEGCRRREGTHKHEIADRRIDAAAAPSLRATLTQATQSSSSRNNNNSPLTSRLDDDEQQEDIAAAAATTKKKRKRREKKDGADRNRLAPEES